MPRIPDYNWHVMPQAPHIRRDVRYSAESFGAGDWAQASGLARAAGNFGDTLTNIGLNEMRKEQAEQAKAAAEAEREAKKAAAAAEREEWNAAQVAARDADNAAAERQRGGVNEYFTTEGKNAVEGWEAFRKAEYDKAEQEITNYAGPEKGRAMFARSVYARRDRNVENGERHYYTQKKAYEMATLQGSANRAAKDFAAAPTADQRDLSLADFQRQVNLIGEKRGMPDEQREQMVADATAKMLTGRLNELLKGKDYDGFEALMDEYGKLLDAGARAELTEQGQRGRLAVETPAHVARLLQGAGFDPAAPGAEAAALKAARAVNSDPAFKKFDQSQRDALGHFVLEDAKRQIGIAAAEAKARDNLAMARAASPAVLGVNWASDDAAAQNQEARREAVFSLSPEQQKVVFSRAAQQYTGTKVYAQWMDNFKGMGDDELLAMSDEKIAKLFANKFDLGRPEDKQILQMVAAEAVALRAEAQKRALTNSQKPPTWLNAEMDGILSATFFGGGKIDDQDPRVQYVRAMVRAEAPAAARLGGRIDDKGQGALTAIIKRHVLDASTGARGALDGSGYLWDTRTSLPEMWNKDPEARNSEGYDWYDQTFLPGNDKDYRPRGVPRDAKWEGALGVYARRDEKGEWQLWSPGGGGVQRYHAGGKYKFKWAIGDRMIGVDAKGELVPLKEKPINERTK